MASRESERVQERAASVASSIEDAVQELLSMTNAAVKKLTEPKPKKAPSTDESSSESGSSSTDEAPSNKEENMTQHQADKRLLEILTETQRSHLEGNEQLRDEMHTGNNLPVTCQGDGTVVDVTNVLEEMPRSEISILDVGGGQPDTISSLSTRSSLAQEIQAEPNAPTSTDHRTATDARGFTDTVGGGLPGDSILSPISYPEEDQRDAGHPKEQEESFSFPQLQGNGQKKLTSSVKSTPQPISQLNSTGNSSTASEVLRQSTRGPKIPDSARLQLEERVSSNKPNTRLNVQDDTALKKVEGSEKPSDSLKPSTQIFIRKSNYVPQTAVAGPAINPKTTTVNPQLIRLPKRRLKEVKSPQERQKAMEDALHARPKRQEMHTKKVVQPRATLAQGVEMDDKENKDGDVDSVLKIIQGNTDMAKRKLLGARGTGMSKRVVPANIIEGKTGPRKAPRDDLTSMLTTAMVSAAPMLQVKQDLESQVKRLTDKLDELEKQKRLEETSKHQDRAKNLERKLEELTTLRLHSLEQLQEQQAAWQSHLLRVIGNMQNNQSRLSSAAKNAPSRGPPRNVRFDGIPESPDVLQTPAPRAQAPYPIAGKAAPKGTSPGNAYLLKNILDHMDVSTPGPSPAIPSHIKNLHDPLADLTPIRESNGKTQPKLVNRTSTPQTEQKYEAEQEYARSAILRSRKEAEDEAERLDIMRKFPSSLSTYMVQDPGPPSNVTQILAGSKTPAPKGEAPRENSLERIRKELEDLHLRRKTLDENLAIIERERGGNNIAANIDFEILSRHPDADPAKIEKLRIRKMVDEQIKALEKQMKDGGSRESNLRAVSPKKDGLRRGGRGRLPPARGGARVDTGLRKKQPFASKPKPGVKKTSGKPAQRARSYSPSDSDVPACPDTEDFVTHVYGKADYHSRRTTVHDPYIHLKSPMKKPTFRKKKAVEIVTPYFIKSAKTQTSPPASAAPHSQYYFSPSPSPVHHPTSVSPTPGQLIPMAIPLGAPRICDGVETVPVIIQPPMPPYATFTPDPQRVIRVYDPTTDTGPSSKKPNIAVISVKGEDGPDLTVQKLENIDIDTPDVTEATGVQSLHSPVQDELPGSTIPLKHDKDDSEGTDGSMHIELRGGAGTEAPIDYHGPSFPPVAPPERHLKASDIADEIDKHELEHERAIVDQVKTMRWVEQEILARILSEIYPPGTQRIQDSGPVQERDVEEQNGEQGSVLLNPESLQLFIDAGLPIDEATVNSLVEEELTKILREMIKRPAHDQTTRPKTPVAPSPAPVVTHAPSYRIPTPLPTPEPSPASSVSERRKTHLHTPSLTPESSMAESLPPREPSPVSSPEPRPPTPKVDSPPKTPEEVTLVETPEATPPSTPTPEPRMPGTPTMSQASKSPPITPKREYPDPWGGAEFPLPEELNMKQKGTSVMTFAPPPDAVDLVVRAVTPPPATPPDRSLSEPDTSTTTSSERGESSISEGQLLISHGEVRAKMKRGQLPEIIEEIFGDEDVQRSMAFQSTLRDANDIQDYEQYSDGEIRLSMRPAMISRVAGLGGRGTTKPHRHETQPGDDPVGIYARPRHPLPSEEEDEDLSVGEVKPRTIVDRRNKFRKWREERSPNYTSGHSFGSRDRRSPRKPKEIHDSQLRGSPLSMDDLHRQEKSAELSSGEDSDGTGASSRTDENLGGNVIVVTPATSNKAPFQLKKTHPKETVRQSRGVSSPLMQNPIDTLASDDFQRMMASTDHSGVIKDSLEESMRKKDDLGGFFDDEKDDTPAQPALKVSLTLPTAEPVISISEPVTDVDDVSEISVGEF